jgi:hypothetical protein
MLIFHTDILLGQRCHYSQLHIISYYFFIEITENISRKPISKMAHSHRVKIREIREGGIVCLVPLRKGCVFLVLVKYSRLLQEEFEDTKRVIRIRISKKNKQHNGQ